MNNVLLFFSVMPEYDGLYFIKDVSDSELEQMKTTQGKYLNSIGEIPVYLELLNMYLTPDDDIERTKENFDNKDWYDDLKMNGLKRDDIGKFDKFGIEPNQILEINNVTNLTVIRTGMIL